MALLLEEGTVVAVDGDTAQVRVARGSACGHCASQETCNALDSVGQEIVIHVENRLRARAGQRIVVGIEERSVLKGAAWIYVLPLVTFFAGYWLAGRLGPQVEGKESVTAILGAMVGLAAGLGFVYLRFRSREAQASYRPQMVKTL